jgi:hypothetical protein
MLTVVRLSNGCPRNGQGSSDFIFYPVPFFHSHTVVIFVSTDAIPLIPRRVRNMKWEHSGR